MTSYHLSKKFLGNVVRLRPKVPSSSAISIEGNIPRVCFSTNPFYCVRSICGSKHINGFDLIEFRLGDTKFINPSIYATTKELFLPPQVSDFKHNKELWSLKSIDVEYLGFLCLQSLLAGHLKCTERKHTLQPATYLEFKDKNIGTPRSLKLKKY